MSHYDLILKNGLVYLPEQEIITDIAVRDGKIVDIGKIDADATEIKDCTGLTILPGLIDTQVHFREPGLTHKEDLETGSMSAALGGVIGFFEMPNTNPSTTSLEAINQKIELAKSKSYTQYAFFMGAAHDNLDVLKNFEQFSGCCGVKIFMGSSTGSLLVEKDENILAVLETVRSPISVHSEDEELLKKNLPIRDAATSAHAHEHWRSAEVAMTSTKRLLNLARKANKKVHVLHITSKDEMEFLAQNKDICTVETTPQHLTLESPTCYDELGTYAQMNPPIRSHSHRMGIWAGIDNGTVDILGSDHAPHTKEEKDKGYPNSPSGMPGVQTIVPIMLNHVNQGKLTLRKLVELMHDNPVRIFNIANKSGIALEQDADFTVVDMNKQITITNKMMATKSGWTPFDHKTIQGFPVKTIIQGQIVMEDGLLAKRKNLPPFEFSSH